MEERLPLYQKGEPVGLLLRREEGLHTVFTADCPGGEGVRKVWLHGQGGRSMLLGTLAPEGGLWRLTRRIPRSSLERQGLAGTVWGEVVSGDGMEGQTAPQEKRPPFTPQDPLIARWLAEEGRGRWQREGVLWRYTFSWQVGQPLPLTPLFCFARVGRGEVSYLFGEKGYPRA